MYVFLKIYKSKVLVTPEDEQIVLYIGQLMPSLTMTHTVKEYSQLRVAFLAKIE